VQHTFDTPGDTVLRIRNAAGEVVLDSDDTMQTTVVLLALRDDESTRDAIDNATVKQEGSVIVVEVPKTRRGFGFGRSPEVGVRITCPHGAGAEVRTASADVELRGRFGDVVLESASGDVRVDQVAGSLLVNTSSGDVTAARVDGDATARVVSGDIRVERARRATANSVSGDIHLGEIELAVAAQSVSGDQRVDAAGGGDIELESVSGDVRVGIRPGVNLWIDATSVSGDMTSELDVQGGRGGEGEVVSLRARTVSGDLQIVRAAGYSSASSSASSAQA
jgi:hypothetical protein